MLAWLDLQEYYISAYKTGKYPDITDDRVYLWGRLYPSNMTISNDPIGIPDNWQWVSSAHIVSQTYHSLVSDSRHPTKRGELLFSGNPVHCT